MPRGHVANEVEIVATPRVMQMSALFDVPPAERSRVAFDVDLPLDDRDWNVGLIVGPSGAGKTSVARALFGPHLVAGFPWPADKSILDAFPAGMSIKDVIGLLTAVGFSSPPSWVRPFHCLSNGEQFRVTVARALAESPGLVVMDEFTSVVDRQVAQVASHTIQKAVRRDGRRFIALACHYDIVEWLQPDWVYQPHLNDFAWRGLQRHPPMEFRIFEVDSAAWKLFKHHHYLSGELHPAARCFGGFVGEQCVAFTSYLHFPHPKVRDIKMGHRLVVLPDYQGLGLGGRLDDWLGQYLHARGYRYHNTVAHPAMVHHYAKSPRWKMIRTPMSSRPVKGSEGRFGGSRVMGASTRHLATYAFEYVPIRGVA